MNNIQNEGHYIEEERKSKWHVAKVLWFFSALHLLGAITIFFEVKKIGLEYAILLAIVEIDLAFLFYLSFVFFQTIFSINDNISDLKNQLKALFIVQINKK
ncbi:hypothetical protein [uncultured Akkermansia sp.]|jgi:nitrogen fixation/metabolism regulation signal transduction histidine kinase|uniref:hypothetical protein n=1 Tax=uncultured Akkermansia sp. TaxID=512294 RepID=UPI0025D0F031|nr:hypothetical protein [uncultured Akkermansia sp.]